MVIENPFHLLGVSADASPKEITRRGRELSNTAETDAERQRYNRAVRELVSDPDAHRRHELLEAPGAGYRDDEWARFGRRYRRNPANLEALAAAGPLRAADFDAAAIIALLVDALLVAPSVDLATGVRDAPYAPELGDSPVEVPDVLFG